ncbi:hypothetical protein [Leptospira brenneri]|uniref:Uncharacterized protein n=1 Tax=Leptospira brenneri TaxID=2023182 RepID=A0A2M9XZ10_9LEPT|nr:hypothetical protein [Leptospira brenneri]PJZ44571.1 hypothetical protein CH361_15920 [Leptospira brenneri]TGK95577.1 hypothetical protein EHQ30_02770 [Leptospira brenneri]
MKPILLITILCFLFNCKKKDSSNTEELLLGLYLLQPTDYVLEWGYPGSQNQIQNTDLTGKTSGVTVKVGGVSATGVSAISNDTLQFTMPTIPGVTENSAVDFSVEKDGAVVFSTKVRYRPLVSWTTNQPHSIYRPIDGRDNKSFIQFTATAADHVFNSFGHTFADLDFYYFTSLNATPIAFAEKRRDGAEFNRLTLGAGTVYVMVKHISGMGGSYLLQIANSSGVVPSSSATLYTPPSLCYDTLGTGPATGNTCAVLQAAYTRTGRCTYPSDDGLTTRNYYNNGFTSGYAQFTCLNAGNGSQNEAESVFLAN